MRSREGETLREQRGGGGGRRPGARAGTSRTDRDIPKRVPGHSALRSRGKLEITNCEGMVKGLCAACQQPVTHLQQRERLPDGGYRHVNGRCNRSPGGMFPASPMGEMQMGGMGGAFSASSPFDNLARKTENVAPLGPNHSNARIEYTHSLTLANIIKLRARLKQDINAHRASKMQAPLPWIQSEDMKAYFKEFDIDPNNVL